MFDKRGILLAVGIGSLTLMGGCLNFTGSDRAADENERMAGRQDRGRNPGSYTVSTQPGVGNDGTLGAGNSGKWQYELHYSDVVVSPDGQYVLGTAPIPGPHEGYSSPGLLLVVHEIATGEQFVFPTQKDLQRINFSPGGKRAYLLQNAGLSVQVLNLDTMEILPIEYDLGGTYNTLDVGPYGRFLVASNVPTSDADEAMFAAWSGCGDNGWYSFEDGKPMGDRCRVHLVDMTGGATGTVLFESPVRDLDWSPSHYELIATLRGATNTPSAQLAFVNPISGSTEAVITLPNCADELKIQPGGHLGLLSPTTCSGSGQSSGVVKNPGRMQGDTDCAPPPASQMSKDPISVIDLEKRQFIQNLPGFGPVVLTPDGSTAIGFTRRPEMLEQWGYNQVSRVGLISVDLDTLDWTVIEYGELEPAYLVSGDGQSLYTYEDGEICVRTCLRGGGQSIQCDEAPANLLRWDLETWTATAVKGIPAKLRQYVTVPGSTDLYTIHEGQVVHIDGDEDTAMAAPTSASFLPQLMNIRPGGQHLVLGRADQPTFHLHPLQGGQASSFSFSL